MEANNQTEVNKKTRFKDLIHGGRISNIESFFMVAMALFIFDLPMMFLEWALIGFLLNWMISLLAAMTFWLWFTLKGVSFVKPSRLFTYLAALGIDLIPGTSASIILAFTWTVGTLIILIMTRVEDVTGMTLPKVPKNISDVKK